MTEERIPTKWDFIASWLREINAPKKVINAAIAIDDALDDLGLGYNTKDWEEDIDNVSSWDRTSFNALYSLISNQEYCTACEDCDTICRHCKLGDEVACTPRRWHADEYFTIIIKWVKKKKMDHNK